jgi:hypothetical protein
MIKPQPIYEYTADGVHYSAYVQMIARHADGTIFAASYDHNTLTTLGKNLIQTLLSESANTTSANNVRFIQITNATFTAAAASTYCCGTEHAVPEDHYGLAPSAGTYALVTQSSWTITHIFTYDGSSGTETIYGAALTTSVTTGAAAKNDFAEALFSTTAPLSAKERVIPLG